MTVFTKELPNRELIFVEVIPRGEPGNLLDKKTLKEIEKISFDDGLWTISREGKVPKGEASEIVTSGTVTVGIRRKE